MKAYPELRSWAGSVESYAMGEKPDTAVLLLVADLLYGLANGEPIGKLLGKTRGRKSNEANHLFFARLYWMFRCHGRTSKAALEEAIDAIDFDTMDIVLERSEPPQISRASLLTRANRLKDKILDDLERQGQTPLANIAKVRNSIEKHSKRRHGLK